MQPVALKANKLPPGRIAAPGGQRASERRFHAFGERVRLARILRLAADRCDAPAAAAARTLCELGFQLRGSVSTSIVSGALAADFNRDLPKVSKMTDRRKKFVKRLVIEELERRAMLSAAPEIAMAASGLTNNSLEDFYKSQVGTEIGGPAGIGMVNQRIGPIYSSPQFSTIDVNLGTSDPLNPDADSGVGQMTITTGANTPGIGSFAMPTAGPSKAGGTGNPMRPSIDADVAAATDAAIESLDTKSPGPDGDRGGKNAEETKPAEVARQVEPAKPTGRRAYDIDAEKFDPSEAGAVGAGDQR